MPDDRVPDVLDALQAENLRLVKIVEDERRHVRAMRERVRELQDEVTRLDTDNQHLKAENDRLARPRARLGSRLALSVGAIGTLMGARLFAPRRRPPMH